MKSRLVAVFTTLALAATMFAFAVGQAKAQDEIVIGMLLAMSGPGKSYGKFMSQGALLAADEINAAGGINGRKLRIEIGDHKGGDVKATTNEFTRMLNLYNVKAVLSSYSPPTIAAQAIAEKSDVVLINGGGWSPKLIGKKYLWNTRMTGDAVSAAILKVAFEDGQRKLAMIYRNETSGIDTANSARETWTALGGTVVAEERYDIEATNYSTQIAKIRTARPDALLSLAFGKQQGVVIKQARDFGYAGPLYGIDFLPENADVAGKAIEGFRFAVDEFDVSSTISETAKYVQAYRAKYNEEPEFYGANYYEATYLFAEVMKALLSEGKPITGENIDAKIREIKSFFSVYGGKMTLQPNGTVSKPIAVFEVRNGARQLLKRVQN